MTVDYQPQMPPLTKARIRRAIEEKRVVTADTAAERDGIPQATVSDWVARGWLKPALPIRPRLYLLDDLYHLRDQLERRQPTRGADGKFVTEKRPG